MFNYLHIQDLNIDGLAPGKIHKYYLDLITDTLGLPIAIPVLVAKGKHSGPVMGLTAAVHGNELNGIPVVQRIFKGLDIESLKGTIIGVPSVNVPGLLRRTRRFVDGTDLNHIMPGKANGNVSQVYASRFFERVITKLDFLIDLHTASNGRVNTFYIRADMNQPIAAKMAELINADIIVHNPASDGTLRGAADENGIPAVTLEIGNPNIFQKDMIGDSIAGIRNVLSHLGFINEAMTPAETPAIICSSSYWIYTRRGGMIRVPVEIGDIIESGQIVAVQQNIFGDLMDEVVCPEKGIVIGKQVSPISQSGGRIIHLGIISE